jgi:hypothetical protein
VEHDTKPFEALLKIVKSKGQRRRNSAPGNLHTVDSHEKATLSYLDANLEALEKEHGIKLEIKAMTVSDFGRYEALLEGHDLADECRSSLRFLIMLAKESRCT